MSETQCPFCRSDKDRQRPMTYRCGSPISIDPREWTSGDRHLQCWREEGKMMRSQIEELKNENTRLEARVWRLGGTPER